MKYIVNAQEFQHGFITDTVFSPHGGYESEAIYFNLCRKNSTFSFVNHNSETLGISIDEYETVNEIVEALQSKYHIFPIYGFSHSGITISVSPSFNNGYDSDMIALALLPMSLYTLDEAKKYIEIEIKHEAAVLEGDYYYIVEGGDVLDSFYGEEIEAMRKKYSATFVESKTVERYFDEAGNEVTL
jgi:hypothetical protein